MLLVWELDFRSPGLEVRAAGPKTFVVFRYNRHLRLFRICVAVRPTSQPFLPLNRRHSGDMVI